MPEFLHGDVTEAVIGAAMEVHRALGAGFVEKIYEKALALELKLQGVRFQRQVKVPVYYKGMEAGVHVLDLLVEGKVVVELKAVAAIVDVHLAFTRSYMTATGLQVGLLLNFGKAKLEVRRV
ncbi:MAG TPA: GxxExxY protein [Symbiobacteriaceae bacterium]|nr:GxxExxY protein [Symbiobacteriaceae bacterium]